jgi:hypothetical protein
LGLRAVRLPRGVGRLPLPTRFDTSGQRASLAAVERAADGLPAPLLVLGDFNVSDRQPHYRALRSRWGDAQRDAGWGLGYTYPSGALGQLPLVGRGS